jgi:hypothetical protein
LNIQIFQNLNIQICRKTKRSGLQGKPTTLLKQSEKRMPEVSKQNVRDASKHQAGPESITFPSNGPLLGWEKIVPTTAAAKNCDAKKHTKQIEPGNQTSATYLKTKNTNIQMCKNFQQNPIKPRS